LSLLHVAFLSVVAALTPSRSPSPCGKHVSPTVASLQAGPIRRGLLVRRFPLSGSGQQLERSVPMMDFTNADRAQRAERALKRYNGDNDAIANAVDFLTDLQHFYHTACMNDDVHPTFDEALESARRHFNEERRGELPKAGAA
jgi:hypothetical protein